MAELQNGMLVNHTTLGLGKIVALDPEFVHVYFAGSEHRFATKLQRSIAAPLLAASSAGGDWLDGLAAFTFDARTGRFGLADDSLSPGEALARFKEMSPDGFAGPDQPPEAKGRTASWRRAHRTFAECLGGGEGEKLLAAGDLAGLVERALRVERHVRPLFATGEKTALAAALADPAVTGPFFAALFAFIATPAPEREAFEALASAASTLPRASAETTWSVATVLPFVARPDIHVAVRPRLVCDAARRLGFELRYVAEPSWYTYQSLADASGRLLERLRPLGARDHMDVEAFMHATATKRPRARAATRPMAGAASAEQ